MQLPPDKSGYLWFATAEGLSRFDGYEFTNYGVDEGLPHALVNALLMTHRGRRQGRRRTDERARPWSRRSPLNVR
jgi:hypothetical protein